ncbi:hypothetical protein HX037_04825 [Ignatzschineria indica]|uniref:hypothetical protein n=1 Tax=Ignatzschineria indica TaxID=472583 RepID=UPI0025754B02|nr:hypothetical protein [Ignatzschineria indica]MDM1545204.1 hypothetical protein [Ignatzschineria indica]
MERRELTISFFSPMHARHSASSIPTAGARFIETRDGDLRQFISFFVLTNHNIVLKKIRGATGTDRLNLFTDACPRFGIFDANCRHAIFGRAR